MCGSTTMSDPAVIAWARREVELTEEYPIVAPDDNALLTWFAYTVAAENAADR
jgi:hypothetical protein